MIEAGALLSQTRQTDATPDATARQPGVSHVAPLRECDTRQTPKNGQSERQAMTANRQFALASMVN